MRVVRAVEFARTVPFAMVRFDDLVQVQHRRTSAWKGVRGGVWLVDGARRWILGDTASMAGNVPKALAACVPHGA